MPGNGLEYASEGGAQDLSQRLRAVNNTPRGAIFHLSLPTKDEAQNDARSRSNGVCH
jgi:hypothetical protein